MGIRLVHNTLALCIFLSLLMASTRSNYAATITWTNSNGGSWSDASNWNPNQVPTMDDDAFITNNGTYTVTLDVDLSVTTLAIGGDMGTQILSWSSGEIGSSAAVTIGSNGLLNITGEANKLIYGVLLNAGTIRWTSSDLYLRGDFGFGHVQNLPSGLFDAQSDQSLICSRCGTNTLFNNAGTFSKSAGTGTTTISVPFNNTGAVDAQTGWIIFGDGSAFHTGTVLIGAGTNLLAGGTVTFDGAIVSTNAQLGGANLVGTSIISGILTWTSGEIDDSAVVSIATNGLLNISGGANKFIYGILTNAGTIRWSSSDLYLRDFGFGSHVQNLPGGLFDVLSNETFGCGPCGTNIFFNNAGLLRKSSGTGTTTLSVHFNNTGTVDVQTGTISFGEGSAFHTGTVFIGAGTNLLAGGTVTLDGAIVSGLSRA